MYTKTCSICGKEFKAQQPTTKFCSKECFNINHCRRTRRFSVNHQIYGKAAIDLEWLNYQYEKLLEKHKLTGE